ncbi:MAG: hypothetical protein HOM11_03015 [Methylococcales bacterium]|jgi:3',5'-cyclic-AMP phosphodiesterase|nr:hypothetical protein [Methylococcales bacterium]MBT7445149.1 hypothetical protein [Methylococcales bacterium]
MTTQTNALSVAQLSDTHLFETVEEKLLGLNTQQSFDATLQHALDTIEHIDFFLLTGDIVQDGHLAGYKRIIDTLDSIGIPTYCLPGNHDESRLMAKHFNTEFVKFIPQFSVGKWQFIMLDTNIPNSASGRFKDDEIKQLGKYLDSDMHTVICMHHNPIHVGSQWLDTMAIDNPELLYNAITPKQVDLMLCGHVHQAHIFLAHEIPLYTAPSTCIQFKPHSTEFALDNVPPGYRHLTFFENGQMETNIKRLDKLPEGIDMVSAGY